MGSFPSIGPPWPGNPNYDSSPFKISTPWLQPSFHLHNAPTTRTADINGDGLTDVLMLRYYTAPDRLRHQSLSSAITHRSGYIFHDF